MSAKPITTVIQRKAMNLIDFFSSVGGIQITTGVIFETITAPFAKFSLMVTLLKSLFIIRQTRFPRLFNKKPTNSK